MRAYLDNLADHHARCAHEVKPYPLTTFFRGILGIALHDSDLRNYTATPDDHMRLKARLVRCTCLASISMSELESLLGRITQPSHSSSSR